MTTRFTCAICGAEHSLADISFGADAPLQWDLLSDEERSESLLAGEQCEIQTHEGRSYYIRGCLNIPIVGTEEEFTWGVWCSLSEKSYSETQSTGKIHPEKVLVLISAGYALRYQDTRTQRFSRQWSTNNLWG